MRHQSLVSYFLFVNVHNNVFEKIYFLLIHVWESLIQFSEHSSSLFQNL